MVRKRPLGPTTVLAQNQPYSPTPDVIEAQTAPEVSKLLLPTPKQTSLMPRTDEKLLTTTRTEWSQEQGKAEDEGRTLPKPKQVEQSPEEPEPEPVKSLRFLAGAAVKLTEDDLD